MSIDIAEQIITSRWFKALSSLGADCIPTLANVLARYNEPHRAYHTPKHLAYMFNHSRVFGDTSPVLDLAIIYHDLVYDIGSVMNEADSANIAYQELREVVPRWVALEIHTLVERTHGDYYDEQPKSWNEAVLRDLDFSGFAGTWETMKQNTNDLEFEFRSKYTERQWLDGRDKFLIKMLGLNNIFWTPQFKAQEDIARKNLKRELAEI